MNMPVSKYWLWFVLIAGLSVVFPYLDGRPLSVHYLDALFAQGVLSPLNLNYIPANYEAATDIRTFQILSHALISVIVAVVITVISQIAARPSKKPVVGETRRFSLFTLCLVTTIIGCIFGLFKYLGSEPVLYFVVLLVVAGRFISLYLTAFFFARTNREKQEENDV
jgi:hypothetical protein